jgi:hypothetical protein
MVPGGAFRIRGNDDDNDATFLTDSLDQCLPPPATSSQRSSCYKGSLPWVLTCNQNAVHATNVHVINEDGGKASATWSPSRLWNFKSEMFLLFVIGTVVTFSIIISRKRSSQDKPTAPPTMSQFSIMYDVILDSSFEDNVPSSMLQEGALDWLVDQYPAYLAVDTNSTTLMERYTAVHFYFAMQGWIKLGGFLRIQYAYVEGTQLH